MQNYKNYSNLLFKEYSLNEYKKDLENASIYYYEKAFKYLQETKQNYNDKQDENENEKR